jgi:hypothetical protein
MEGWKGEKVHQVPKAPLRPGTFDGVYGWGNRIGWHKGVEKKILMT